MNSNEIVFNKDIIACLDKEGFIGYTADKGRLMLMELLASALACHYISHTQDRFVCSFGLLKNDRTLSKKGNRFMASMILSDSAQTPEYCKLVQEFRAN